jgi:hypothetical protein
MSWFFKIYLFYKIGEEESRTGLACGGWYHWEGAGRKVCGMVNIVQMHVCMIPVETIPGMGGKEDKGKW